MKLRCPCSIVSQNESDISDDVIVEFCSRKQLQIKLFVLDESIFTDHQIFTFKISRIFFILFNHQSRIKLWNFLMQMCNTTIWMVNLVLIFLVGILFILEIVRYINQFYKKPFKQWTSFWIFADRLVNKERFSLSELSHRIIIIVVFPIILFIIFFLRFMPIMSLYGTFIMLALCYFIFLTLLGLSKLQEAWIAHLAIKLQILFSMSIIVVMILLWITQSIIQPCPW